MSKVSNVYIDNEIKITNVNDTFFNFIKKNLTFTNPEYTRRVHNNLYLGKTSKDLVLYRVKETEDEGRVVYVPYGFLVDIDIYCEYNHIDVYYINKLEVGEHIDYPEVPLRDYQLKAVKGMITAEGGILRAPAGSGKTQIGLGIIKRLGLKTLWLTHTKDLLNQTKKRAEEYFDSDLIGTITEGKVNIGKGLTIATVQTMVNLDLSLYKSEWDVIIVDECHRVSGSANKVKQFQKVLENLSATYKYGLSATVHRADGLIGTTEALIGAVKYIIKEEEVRDFITPVSIKPIYTHIELKQGYTNYDGTIDYNTLITALTRDDDRNNCIYKEMVFNSFNSNLILSDRLEHLHTLFNLLPPCYQKRAAIIDGSMTSKEGKEQREKAIEGMRDGSINYLFATYKLAKEGLDIPPLDRLYLTTPQKDYAVVVQSIGRVARKDENKDKPIVYDFVDEKIDYLVRMYKKRLAIYKKERCEIL